MQAKQKPVDKLSLQDLGLSTDSITPAQRIDAVSDAAEKGPGEVIEDPDEGVAKAVQFLADSKVI
jgi:electron transfer flavoprotein alpha/beta subunit